MCIGSVHFGVHMFDWELERERISRHPYIYGKSGKIVGVLALYWVQIKVYEVEIPNMGLSLRLLVWLNEGAVVILPRSRQMDVLVPPATNTVISVCRLHSRPIEKKSGKCNFPKRSVR